jgi:phospholipase/carboxylesterase
VSDVASEPAVEVEPEAPAEASVILFHGLGADGHDFEALVTELRLPPHPAIRWVFPHAPVRAVTLNAGYRMRAWFDIFGLDRLAAVDGAGIRAAVETAAALIGREVKRGVKPDRILLAGFSQGGAVALNAGLRHPHRLAGIVALSTYLPLEEALATEAHPANASIPLFMAHGTHDPVVSPSLGAASRDLLLARGYAVDWHAYPMGHELCAQEIADVREWLLRVLS